MFVSNLERLPEGGISYFHHSSSSSSSSSSPVRCGSIESCSASSIKRSDFFFLANDLAASSLSEEIP